MNTSESNFLADDSVPFVNESCGDSMWDEVLAQPDYMLEHRHPLSPFATEMAQQKVQTAQGA